LVSQKFSKAQDKLRPRRGFGNSFQPAIDAPKKGAAEYTSYT
jgi:hypothetical protein